MPGVVQQSQRTQQLGDQGQLLPRRRTSCRHGPPSADGQPHWGARLHNVNMIRIKIATLEAHSEKTNIN